MEMDLADQELRVTAAVLILQREMDLLISATPTGPKRDIICNANIVLQYLKLHLQEVGI
jgi:hypothetical protein